MHFGVKVLHTYVVGNEQERFYEELILRVKAESFDEAYEKAGKYMKNYVCNYINIDNKQVKTFNIELVDCFLAYDSEDDVQEIYSSFFTEDGKLPRELTKAKKQDKPEKKEYDYISFLSKYFGYSSFREGQETIVKALLDGRDAVAIMPTGGGKSICYQLPALMLDGLAIVISPLVSLMKDQVMQLTENGIAAAYLNSTLSSEQSKNVYHNLYNGKYKILYVSPERLEMQGFVEFCKKVNISVVAVDEAHCISQWGNDFRPSYLKINEFIERITTRPMVAAFTATATEKVCNDIIEKLKLRDPILVTTGFDRPNLNFAVENPRDKKKRLLELIKSKKTKCGIVYCASRKNVEQICEYLCNNGISATRYHAGLSDDERKRNQDDFVFDNVSVIVATNAFGMGINKSNVNYVIHYNMPISIEAYYQEAGRAGRDGEQAECILLYSPSDIALAKLLIESSENQDETLRKNAYARLQKMIDYCKSSKCLRGMLLDYFGCEYAEKCGNCSNCDTTFVKRDITVDAQKILSCIKRISTTLGYDVGALLIAKTLHGSRDKRVLQLRLNKLSTYGIMQGNALDDIVALISHLEDEGYLKKDKKHGGISLSSKADDVLFAGKSVYMESRNITPEPKKKIGGADAEIKDDLLYQQLRDMRSVLAKRKGVPAFVIVSNATLVDMAAKKPTSLRELLKVAGIGSTKATKYGEYFINTIKKYNNGGMEG